MSRDERPLAAVPRALWVLLAVALAGQIAWQHPGRPRAPAAADLPPPPSVQALRLAAFGEPEALARVAMLYLQSFDLGAGNALPYQQLDYRRLVAWLRNILALDPRSDYPLFSAARIYAEVLDPARSRIALEFVYEEFLRDPNHRWPWLAHAALVAKHRLGDLPLARRYAAAIDRYTTAPDVPLWAKQMEIFILEDMNEADAARIMLGGLLESGNIHDPAEARFLAQRLKELEARRGSR
ncbi:MAG: hypothetical protein EPO20_09060 [Betaproteobacteria bacterium]|nr:MAG: hypothetical protein EPO20_09060 [Betaproteobacteria bacterium]